MVRRTPGIRAPRGPASAALTLQHGRGRVEVEGHGLHQVVVGVERLQLVPHQDRLPRARVPHQHHRPLPRHQQVHEVADPDGLCRVHHGGLPGKRSGDISACLGQGEAGWVRQCALEVGLTALQWEWGLWPESCTDLGKKRFQKKMAFRRPKPSLTVAAGQCSGLPCTERNPGIVEKQGWRGPPPVIRTGSQPLP